jgi:predicted DNA-binding ribbon-helix-helix protein
MTEANGHLRRRSVTLAGHRTSIALEPAFWRVLEARAVKQGTSLARVVAEVDNARPPGVPLASALRVACLEPAGD